MLTFIDTKKLPRVKTPYGDFTEILNRELCGAENVLGVLRRLQPGERFGPETLEKHQLLYLMEGKARIHLDGKSYEVTKGAGVYLGPLETATIEAPDDSSIKIFHLTVPKIPG